MKKVLVIGTAFNARNGGVEKHLRFVFRELKKQGWQPVMLARYEENLLEFSIEEGVEVWRLPKVLSRKNLILWVARHSKSFVGASAIHSHDLYIDYLHRLLPHINWVHTFHGYEGYPVKQEAIDARQFIRSRVKTCFGVGEFIEKWYETKLDHVIYGAVEQLHDAPPPPTYDLAFVGRLETDTGIQKYLEAFKVLASQGPNLSMLVVGYGSLETECRKYATDHSLDVAFTGAVADALPYFAQGRVVCVGGYLSILEGAVNGRSMIVYYDTPIREDYARCHPLADDYHLAGSVKEMVAAYDECFMPAEKERVERAQEWAKHQTWSNLARAYIQAYQKH